VAKWLDGSTNLAWRQALALAICVRWGPSSPCPKGAQAPIFGPYLLWPSGWMDQDTTWQGGRPRLKWHCVRWGPCSTPQKRGHSPQFLAHVYCGQTAGWMKMPLGMEVGLSPGHIVLDGDPAPPPQKGHSPQFSAHVSCMAKWSPISATAEHLFLTHLQMCTLCRKCGYRDSLSLCPQHHLFLFMTAVHSSLQSLMCDIHICGA